VEPNKSVKSSIAQLMGVIAKHLKNLDKDWPELLQFFQDSITNNDPEKQEVCSKISFGMFVDQFLFQIGTLTLKNVLDTCSGSLARFLPSFCILFKHVLENSTNLAAPSVYNTIVCMKHLVPCLEDNKVCL
jgi:hypothetical protein